MAQTSGDITYLPMSLMRHNPAEVACLIYQSAPELFDLMFGSRAVPFLTEFVQRSHNRFSHQYIRVAELDRRVVGMVVLVPASCLSDTADYNQVLNVGRRLWLKLVRSLVLRHVLRHEYPVGTFYIGSLAVVAEYRNQGIGRQLLCQCVATAKLTASPIFISVDVGNHRAQKLYESLGFRVVETKTIVWYNDRLTHLVVVSTNLFVFARIMTTGLPTGVD